MIITVLTNISPRGNLSMLLIQIIKHVILWLYNRLNTIKHIHGSQVAFGHKTSDLGVFKNYAGYDLLNLPWRAISLAMAKFRVLLNLPQRALSLAMAKIHVKTCNARHGELYRAQTFATARNMLAMASHSRTAPVSAKNVIFQNFHLHSPCNLL
jgi:hypothetical protein